MINDNSNKNLIPKRTILEDMPSLQFNTHTPYTHTFTYTSTHRHSTPALHTHTHTRRPPSLSSSSAHRTGELLKDKNPILICLTCPTPTKVFPGLFLRSLHSYVVTSRPSSHSLYYNLRPLKTC